ncbi:crotonase/enoyl-CoA hydratase family protein [Planktomarina sp.]|uniref:crotonase/enoyl-CoA hydratase family protein n=1 Tax=Planktomarina sp. TaxID=2024851 RepID=UPI00288CC710|nr:crotonase/enoyl-CoA hydratase family protein [Planktomarina sp.]
MSDLLYEQDGHVVTLTINRPSNLNALGVSDDGKLFHDACKKINADRNVRCAILTGAGRAFSAGGDLKAMAEKTGAFSGPATDVREGYRNGIHQIIRSLWGLEIPLIAAVNGHAIGLGNDIATLADIRIASEEAKFGATFINAGLVPGDGGAWLLPRAIGRSRAAELFFTGDLIDAQTALAWGLVSRVVPQAGVMVEARKVAEKIAAKSPIPVRMTKQMMRQADTSTLDNILEMSANMQALAQCTEDHMAALQGVLNKTSPTFAGK